MNPILYEIGRSIFIAALLVLVFEIGVLISTIIHLIVGWVWKKIKASQHIL